MERFEKAVDQLIQNLQQQTETKIEAYFDQVQVHLTTGMVKGGKLVLLGHPRDEHGM